MPCMNQRRRHRRRHHRRMPTFGKHHGSVTGAPLHSTLTRFATGHGLWRSHTLDKCLSPAGLHPNAASVRDHLHDLYDRLKGGDELLSRAKFENFLLDVQKDQKKPSWAFSDSATFGFEQFEQLWWAEYSAAKRPIHPDDKDLDKPISNYFINSSHNTYIEDGNQITGEAKALQYKKVSPVLVKTTLRPRPGLTECSRSWRVGADASRLTCGTAPKRTKACKTRCPKSPSQWPAETKEGNIGLFCPCLRG